MPQRERVFNGIGVSHGIAIAPAYIVELERPQVPEYKIPPGEAAAEQKRFEDAVARVREELTELKTKLEDKPETAAEEVTLLLDAHLAMISGSRLVRGAVKKIAEDNVNAEWALDRVMHELADQFRALHDNYIATRIDDVQAVGYRILRALLNLPYLSLDNVPPGGIVLAREISPADTALIDPKRIAGIATIHGGAAGSAAMLFSASRSLCSPFSRCSYFLRVSSVGLTISLPSMPQRAARHLFSSIRARR